jgi:hypothetical protein
MSGVFPEFVSYGEEEALAMAWNRECNKFEEKRSTLNFFFAFRNELFKIEPVDTRIIEFSEKPCVDTVEASLSAWFGQRCILRTEIANRGKGDVLMFVFADQ